MGGSGIEFCFRLGELLRVLRVAILARTARLLLAPLRFRHARLDRGDLLEARRLRGGCLRPRARDFVPRLGDFSLRFRFESSLESPLCLELFRLVVHLGCRILEFPLG